MKHNEIKEIIALFDESDITTLRIKDKEFSIMLQKGIQTTQTQPAPTQVVAPQPTAVASTPISESSSTPAPAPASDAVTINSPMVGTFYIAPSPGAAPFAKVGDRISKGQTIGIVEAMKIMNEIEAEFDCKILKMLVEDGQPVEFGTPLFEVEKL